MERTIEVGPACGGQLDYIIGSDWGIWKPRSHLFRNSNAQLSNIPYPVCKTGREAHRGRVTFSGGYDDGDNEELYAR